MGKNDSPKPQRKKSMGKIRIAFSSMILFVLFLMEIYLMVNATQYFVGLVTVSVLLIAVLYILVTSVIQVNYEKEQELLDEFDDIFKSEKATYLLMRKSFEDFNERLAFLEDNIKTPTEEIIAAQKAIAKVSISRNKENSDALMNSNDKLLERFFAFEDLINENNTKLLEQQKLIVSQANQEILIKQQEALSRLKELELSIKNEILQSVNTITSSQPQVILSSQPQMVQSNPVPVMPQNNVEPELVSTEDFAGETAEVSMDELSFGEESQEPELSSMEDFLKDDFEEEAIAEEMPIIEEPEPEPESEPVVEEVSEPEPEPAPVAEEAPAEEPSPMPELSSDPNHIMTPDEIAALLQATNENSEPSEPEPVIEEAPAEEPSPMPELSSDPNHIMTPDEIAALLQATNGASEPSEPEPEPVIEEAPAEEKPPMPDLSDPNHVMTPDEIAALLANM